MTLSKATDEVAKTKALYNYERNQRIAQENIMEAERFKYSLIIVCSLSVILVLFVIGTFCTDRPGSSLLPCCAERWQSCADRLRIRRLYAHQNPDSGFRYGKTETVRPLLHHPDTQEHLPETVFKERKDWWTRRIHHVAVVKVKKHWFHRCFSFFSENRMPLHNHAGNTI